MLVSTKDMLVKAKKGKYAVANFCIWNVEMLSGVMEACEELHSPVILSFGSGFLQNTDINHFIHMMRSYATTTTLPASIHWDHGRSFEIVSHAIDIGYNSLMIDGSAYDFETNIKMTKEVVDKFKPMGIPIEAELGHVGAETDYEEALANYGYTDPSQAAEFVARTNIDSLAIAIGNQHGAYSAPPQINFDILQAVADAVAVPLVLHGASGISDEDVSKSIDMGITKVNIHTELCEAAMIAINANYEKKESYLALNQAVRAEVKKRAMEKIRLFRSDGKADGWFAEK